MTAMISALQRKLGRPESLERYAGRYQTAAGVHLSIGHQRGALYASLRGLPPILLLSEGGGLFFSPENGLSIEFRLRPDGRVAGFVLRQSGRPDLSADRLASLAA